MAKEKKGAKFGRNRERRPSAKVYLAAKRWVTNKAKCAKRHTRRMAMKAIHRIEWEIKKGKTTLQASASRLIDLRQVVSQHRTG